MRSNNVRLEVNGDRGVGIWGETILLKVGRNRKGEKQRKPDDDYVPGASSLAVT